jgi:hypothetical protein
MVGSPFIFCVNAKVNILCNDLDQLQIFVLAKHSLLLVDISLTHFQTFADHFLLIVDS